MGRAGRQFGQRRYATLAARAASNAMTLRLIVPGLFWPDAATHSALAELPLPGLRQLLANGHAARAPAVAAESLAAHALGWPDPPLAALRLLGQGQDPGSAYWLCADPVHLKVTLNALALIHGPLLPADENTLPALTKALNTHFADDAPGLFLALGTGCGYLRLNTPLSTSPAPLSLVTGQHIEPFLPAGRQSPLRSWLNDIQMVCYSLPANEDREARGLLPINSLWLWGGGQGTTPPEEALRTTIFANDSISKGIAAALGVRCAPCPPRAFAAHENEACIVLPQLALHAAFDDSGRYAADLETLDRYWFQPLADALRRGQLAQLAIHAQNRNGRQQIAVAAPGLLGRLRWKPGRAADLHAALAC